MLFSTDMINLVMTMMAQGHTPTEVASALGISKKTLARHIKTDETLREAYEIGLTKFEAKLEGIGRDIMLGHIPNAKEGTWKMFIQRYGEGWADKAEIKDTTNSGLTDEELADKIKALSRKDGV